MQVATLDRSHPVPIEALSAHVGVLGKTGSGKSYAARGCVERLLDEQRRVVVIDPTGVWWGLRSSSNGKAEGYPVAIFGGDHADVPITDASGARLGEFLAARTLSAIVDVSEFSNNGQRAFMEGFLDALYRLNKRPVHLVIDEADAFAPQSSLPEMRRVLGHMSKIVRRGRVKGFRVMMITQRPATIHKDVFTQINSLIAKRVTAPQDRKAIEEWVKGQADAEAGKQVLDSLARMEREEGWLWAPEIDVLKRARFPRIKTFDSMRAPEEGESAEPETLADVDVAALIAELGAESEPDAPDSAPRVDVDAIKRAAREEGRRAGYAEGMAAGLRQAVEAVEAVRQGGVTPAADMAPIPEVAITPAPSRRSGPAPSGEEWVAAAERIWPARLTWSQLGWTIGRKARGGHFNSLKKALLERGVMRDEGGIAVLNNPPSVPAGIRPADLLSDALPEPARKMFVALRSRPMSAEQLGSSLGMAPRGGHWNSGMAVLKTAGLIEQTGDKWTVRPELERSPL